MAQARTPSLLLLLVMAKSLPLLMRLKGSFVIPLLTLNNQTAADIVSLTQSDASLWLTSWKLPWR